jgi:hypothetical protein
MSDYIAFTHPALTPIIGAPTNATLSLLKRQLYANARGIVCSRGGGAHGYLGLVQTAAAYDKTAPNTPFVPPVWPGDRPIYPPEASAALKAEIKDNFKHDSRLHREYMYVSIMLKQQVINAVEPRFLTELQDPMYGFHSVSIIDIIEHLFVKYGRISDQQLCDNVARLKSPWHPDTPILDLWNRVAECCRLAKEADEPISEPTAISYMLTIIDAHSYFQHWTREWREKPRSTWTLVEFKALFDTAHATYTGERTANAAGFSIL